MKKLALVGLALLLGLSMIPASADDPTTPLKMPDRYVPQAPGTVRTDLTFVFGPYHIPPGQDENRVTLDLPVHTGFITAVAPNLLDAVTGDEPTEFAAHIHHAHWLRVTTDPRYEVYSTGLSWVFGTGEEKTQGSLDDRSAATNANKAPGAPDIKYGIFVDGTVPQTLIYMIHNKTAGPLNVYVTLDVDFVYGTAEQIKAANVGFEMREVTGVLWGQTRDVERNEQLLEDHYVASAIERERKFDWDATIVAGAGHLHPGGMVVTWANLGPDGQCKDLDQDGDGLPGVTIFNSRKMDRVPEAWPFSEQYQMGATKFGFRAPIHKGDVIRQFGIYDTDENAWYEAMSYSGIYADKAEVPVLANPTNVCALENYTSRLLPGDPAGGDPREGILNHAWHGETLPVCFGTQCNGTRSYVTGTGEYVQTVQMADFLYLPGDLGLQGTALGTPRVRQGTTLTFVNEDAAAKIRHSVTSCPAPCTGPYAWSNYPLPDGEFDSGKLGNTDYIDGGFRDPDTVPVWQLDTTTMAPGLHTYYCRIHPFMRGAFEVTT